MSAPLADLPPPPAIIAKQDLPFAAYLKLEAASSHGLSMILDRSPLHYRSAERTPTAAQDLGTLAHTLILEPDQAANIVIKPDVALSSNAGKAAHVEWACEALGCDPPPPEDPKAAAGKTLDAQIAVLADRLASSGKTIVTREQWDSASRMRDAVAAHPIARVLFGEGQPEATLLAEDPRTGALCKGRADWICRRHSVLVDLKTAASAAPGDVSRAAARYAYHQQGAFYRHLWHLVSGETWPFWFVFVESAAPYAVLVAELDEEALEAGQRRYERALDLYAEALNTGVWPGYGWSREAQAPQIETLSLPRWALY